MLELRDESEDRYTGATLAEPRTDIPYGPSPFTLTTTRTVHDKHAASISLNITRAISLDISYLDAVRIVKTIRGTTPHRTAFALLPVFKYKTVLYCASWAGHREVIEITPQTILQPMVRTLAECHEFAEQEDHEVSIHSIGLRWDRRRLDQATVNGDVNLGELKTFCPCSGPRARKRRREEAAEAEPHEVEEVEAEEAALLEDA